MLRLFLREIVRVPRLHNKKSKLVIFNVIAWFQPYAPPPFSEYHSLSTGTTPLLNWRFAYVIISNDVFVYISEPHSKARL